MSNAPIFIVGAPRSGTTLLRNLLNRHPRLAICGETRFYHYVYMRRRSFGDLANPTRRLRLIAEYLSTERAERLGMRMAELRARLERYAVGYREFFTCLLEFYAESQGKPRYGEKTPHHALFAETLCEWYPGATILHLVRDPRDVVASLQRMPWAANSIVANAGIWKECNLAAARSSHRTTYLLIRYEQLVSDPEQELIRICSFLGEDFTASMLAPDTSPPANHTQMRPHQLAVTQERLGLWKQELTTGQVSLIEWKLGDGMDRFGYPRAERAPSAFQITRGVGVAMFDAVRKQIAEFPGIWYRLAQPSRISAEEYWKHHREWERERIFPAARSRSGTRVSSE